MSSITVTQIENLNDVQPLTAITSQPGYNDDYIVMSIATHQNNYNIMVSSSNQVHSIVNLIPSNTVVISGIDTSGMQKNKRFTLRNASDSSSSSAYLIILNREDWDSATSNQFMWQERTMPGLLMPDEHIDFLFDGVNVKITGGYRYSSGINIYDFAIGRPSYTINFNSGGGSVGEGRGLHDGGMQTCYVTTNTTSANGAAQITHADIPNLFLGLGSVAFVDDPYVAIISTPTDPYMCYSGLTKAYGHTGWDLDAMKNPREHVGFMYDPAFSNNYTLITRSANVSTTTVLNVPVEYYGVKYLGFINGDASRVDFVTCYTNYQVSTDTRLRNIFHKNVITHTTNIPNESINSSLYYGAAIAQKWYAGGPGPLNRYFYGAAFGVLGGGYYT
jgi:hypothetical protein